MNGIRGWFVGVAGLPNRIDGGAGRPCVGVKFCSGEAPVLCCGVCWLNTSCSICVILFCAPAVVGVVGLLITLNWTPPDVGENGTIILANGEDVGDAPGMPNGDMNALAPVLLKKVGIFGMFDGLGGCLLFGSSFTLFRWFIMVSVSSNLRFFSISFDFFFSSLSASFFSFACRRSSLLRSRSGSL